MPFISAADELKTKPTQHSVMRLREIGIQPDFLICRTDRKLPEGLKDKIALFCSVPSNAVIEARDVSTIYEVPMMFEEQNFAELILKHFKMATPNADLENWQNMVSVFKKTQRKATIAICGKYVTLPDAYKSIIESFVHAGIENNARIELKWINTEKITGRKEAHTHLNDVDAILVPGGFGERGIEGKLNTIEYARTGNIPFFGICLGLQCAVIEYARNVVGLKNANSTEFDPDTPYPVIHIMENQLSVVNKGGTMRLGAYDCDLKEGTAAFRAYGMKRISERHRHRFEVNNDYREQLENAGMTISGINPQESLVEMIELPDHPWFVGCQFHPELKSRAVRAHPLFREFVRMALNEKENRRR